MAVQVQTNDSAALTDADLDELASMGGAFGIGELSKAKEDWVLITMARIDGKLHGFTFSTLERIGGTPCVLLGLMSVRRSSRREQVLRGLMAEAYHRALMAFPDEDVVVGSRFIAPHALDAFKELDDVTPSPGTRAVGEERAWGRRLAKRFDVESMYDEKNFIVRSGGQEGFIDHEPAKPAAADPARAALFRDVPAGDGGSLIVYGWTMAEDLVKLGRAPRALIPPRPTMPEFADVVRRRRMTRAFDGRPVPPELLAELVDLGSRAPSAGKTQGWHLVVLEGQDTQRFWDITLPAMRRNAFRWKRLLDAPVVAIALADPRAYTDRYSESDKKATGLGTGVDAWPAPYWTIDASMSVMTILLAAEAVGLGALFFGVFKGERQLRRVLGIPSVMQVLGAIAFGWPVVNEETGEISRGGADSSGVDDASPTGPGRSTPHRRRTPEEIIHRGGWRVPTATP